MGGGQKNEYFEIFGGSSQTGLVLRVTSMYFKVFS